MYLIYNSIHNKVNLNSINIILILKTNNKVTISNFQFQFSLYTCVDILFITWNELANNYFSFIYKKVYNINILCHYQFNQYVYYIIPFNI